MRSLVGALFGTISLALSAGCAKAPLPKWPVSPPRELCADPSLGDDDFCMPSARLEAWLRGGKFDIVDAAMSPSGLTSPYKLRLRLPNGQFVSAKFKRAPNDLDAFNNSPRREIAAYEIQKLFLDEDDYVVPPSVLYCLPVRRYAPVFPKLEPHEGADCAVGVLAYWIEGITSKNLVDEHAFSHDAGYRKSLGNLNALTVLIGHQDSLGDNFYRTKDPAHQRLFSVDNGLAFGAMGENPVQWISSRWASVRVDAMPAPTIERLRRLEPRAFDRLQVVAELELRDGTYVSVTPTQAFDTNKVVRKRGDRIQFGLSASEITDVNVRLVKMLGEVAAGGVHAD